jgi:mRNA interferase MazF
MTNYNPSDIVLVPFPFTDLRIQKKRPALILKTISSKSIPPLAIISMITSQVDSEFIEGDLLITKYEEAGLLFSSKIRLAKLVSIEQSLILQKLGTLSKSDLRIVQQEWKKFFNFTAVRK